MTNSEHIDFRGRKVAGERTPLEVVSSAFDRIAREPVAAGPPPPRGVAVRTWGDVGEHLRAPAMPVDAVWSWLIQRARLEWGQPGGRAGLACAGLAVPMLAGITGRFAAPGSIDRDDAEAEIIAGFLRQIREIDLEPPRLWSRLWSVTVHVGRAWARQQAMAPPAIDLDIDTADAPPPITQTPHGHPELVLADAVAEGVITAEAAELIAATRWERRSMTSVAEQLRGSQSHWKVRKQRQRAETKLGPWLATRTESPEPAPDSTGHQTGSSAQVRSTGSERGRTPTALQGGQQEVRRCA